MGEPGTAEGEPGTAEGEPGTAEGGDFHKFQRKENKNKKNTY